MTDTNYVAIDYMYRDAQNTKTFSKSPMLFLNPAGYEIGEISKKLESLGLHLNEGIFFKDTFGGFVKYENLTPGPEEEDWYDGVDGDDHAYMEVIDIYQPSDMGLQAILLNITPHKDYIIPTINQLFEKLQRDGVAEP